MKPLKLFKPERDTRCLKASFGFWVWEDRNRKEQSLETSWQVRGGSFVLKDVSKDGKRWIG